MTQALRELAVLAGHCGAEVERCQVVLTTVVSLRDEPPQFEGADKIHELEWFWVLRLFVAG